MVVESPLTMETYPIGWPLTRKKAFCFLVAGWDGDFGSSLTIASGLQWWPAKVITFVSK